MTQGRIFKRGWELVRDTLRGLTVAGDCFGKSAQQFGGLSAAYQQIPLFAEADGRHATADVPAYSLRVELSLSANHGTHADIETEVDVRHDGNVTDAFRVREPLESQVHFFG